MPDRVARFSVVRAAILVVAIGLPLLVFVNSTVNAGDDDVTAQDFAMFYTAADLANRDRWDLAYDLEAFTAHFSSVTGVPTEPGGPSYGYPPPFAQMLQPLVAVASLSVAGVVFVGLTMALALWQFRRLGAPPRAMILLALSYPFVLSVWLGQNSLLSFALAAAMVVSLLAGRSLVAGLLLGLLVYKPQLLAAFSVMFLLSPRRHAKVLAGAAVSASLVMLTSLLASPSGWREFPDGLLQLVSMSGNNFRIGRVSAIDFSLLLLGDRDPIAYLLGGLLGALGVWWFVWVRRRALGDLELEVAAGFVLASWLNPWMFVYEWVLLGVPAWILFRRGLMGRSQGALMYMALCLGGFVGVSVAGEQVRQRGTALQLAVPAFVVVVVMAFRKVLPSSAAEENVLATS
jgi:alpha-1,2-mannosyltransferase